MNAITPINTDLVVPRAIITFPPNPTVGQIYTVGTQSWVWTGVTWTAATQGGAFVPLSGNVTMTGPLNLKGVTDGSSAVAGQVGEFLTNTGSFPSGGGGAVTTATTLALSAGRWLIWGRAGVTITAGSIATFSAGLSLSPTVVNDINTLANISTTISGGGMANLSMALPPTFMTNAASATYYLNALCQGAGLTSTVTAVINAMRAG